MTHTPTRSPSPLRDVLYALALAKSIPDANLVDEFVRRYPEHAAALTAFAIELAIDAAGESANAGVDSIMTTTSPAVSRAMSRFQNRLHVVRLERKAREDALAPVADNPFTALDRTALRNLSQRLGANTVFVMKLRDRQIRPDTITDGFKSRVAAELNVPVKLITDHFAAVPQMTANAHFKADQRPQVGPQQSFEEAVKSSGLTLEQQGLLLAF